MSNNKVEKREHWKKPILGTDSEIQIRKDEEFFESVIEKMECICGYTNQGNLPHFNCPPTPDNKDECSERGQHCRDKGTGHNCALCCFCGVNINHPDNKEDDEIDRLRYEIASKPKVICKCNEK